MNAPPNPFQELEEPHTPEEWQHSVNLAHQYGLINSARKLKIALDGPPVGEARVAAILQGGAERGILPNLRAGTEIVEAVLRDDPTFRRTFKENVQLRELLAVASDARDTLLVAYGYVRMSEAELGRERDDPFGQLPLAKRLDDAIRAIQRPLFPDSEQSGAPNSENRNPKDGDNGPNNDR